MISIFTISCQRNSCQGGGWRLKLSVWAHLEMTAVYEWHWDYMIGACLWMCEACILQYHICLPYHLSQVEASLYLIEVSWVNVVNLIRTSSLWLCDVKSSRCLTQSPPCLEWLHPGVDKAWNGGGSGTVAKGRFPLRKAHIDFHSAANSVTSPLCHSSAVYFAPLIPRAGRHEKSIAWKWMGLRRDIIYCKVLTPNFISSHDHTLEKLFL